MLGLGGSDIESSAFVGDDQNRVKVVGLLFLPQRFLVDQFGVLLHFRELFGAMGKAPLHVFQQRFCGACKFRGVNLVYLL